MSVDYTENERQALELMQRADFKHLSKGDILNIVSTLRELRPDVAKEIVRQFPEFTQLIRSTMVEYKDILGVIISSDDDNVNHVYDIAASDLNSATDSRKLYYDFAGKVHEDLSKCLGDSNLTAEDRKLIIDQEMEILKAVSEKDSEIRNHEAEIAKMVERKDSEKRRFNWNVLEVSCLVLLAGIDVLSNIWGREIKLK